MAEVKRTTRSDIIPSAAEAAYYTGSCKDAWCVLETKKMQRSKTTIQVIRTKWNEICHSSRKMKNAKQMLVVKVILYITYLMSPANK